MTVVAEQALAAAEPHGYDNDVRWCLWASAHGSLAAGDLAGARRLAERAHDVMTGEDPFGHYCAVEVLSIMDALSGDPVSARRRAEAELVSSRQQKVRLGLGALMHALGVAALAADDLPTARRWADALYAQEKTGAGYLAWHAQEVLMCAALAAGEPDVARAHSEALTAHAQRLGNRRALAIAQRGLARVLLMEHDDPGAERLAHSALAEFVEHGWRLEAVATLDLLAAIAARTGRAEQAARLFAAAHVQRAALGVVRVPPEPSFWETHRQAAEAALGPEAYDDARIEGEQLSLVGATAYAQRGRGPRRSCGFGWDGLTRVEQQVAELAAHGLSNPQIACELFMARGTVKAHLSNVYAKLGVSNRTELAASAGQRAAIG